MKGRATILVFMTLALSLILVILYWATQGGDDGPPAYPNAGLESYDPGGGYREGAFEPGPLNTDSTYVFLTFSGGGTRAAAMAYGVLRGLEAVPIPPGPGGEVRTLLDEVDTIAAISGGSFTALAYGIWGKELLKGGHFEERFLRHDIEGELLSEVGDLQVQLKSEATSDIAAEYYDAHVFKGATYGDLLSAGRRPFISVGAADMARQSNFAFSQRDFDLLGSDPARLPVACAAAASSAFPPLLSPLRFRYFHTDGQRRALEESLRTGALLARPRIASGLRISSTSSPMRQRGGWRWTPITTATST